jgi:hypothetical protein
MNESPVIPSITKDRISLRSNLDSTRLVRNTRLTRGHARKDALILPAKALFMTTSPSFPRVH